MAEIRIENISDSVQGTCYSMCPNKERWLREREGLLHVLEIDESTKNLKAPKADPTKIVKCFGRPAAGKATTDPSELRPGPVLWLTLRYLMENVSVRSDVNWVLVYEFIFDRLRAIRQDIVVQRIDASTSIRLYEPIVRFHIYAGERMCEKSLEEYVPKFNDQHLLECIKLLLVLYDKRDECSTEIDDLARSTNALIIRDNRSQFEALYILLHLGDSTALRRALSLPRKYKEAKHVKIATEISLAWYLRNYVRACRAIGKLPPLLACAALGTLPSIKRNALHIMSSGYNSQSLTYPGLKLQEILLYTDIEKIRNDCDLFGLTFTNENVQFQKAKFNDSQLTALPEQHFKDAVLHKLLPKILLE